MNAHHDAATRRRVQSERGSTLIETVVATSVMLALMLGLLGLTSLATVITENEGHLTARTTEYAQDKMEQLLALSFNDTTSDTRVFPATDTGGTGLTVGGSSTPTSPVAKYVDYLDVNGALLASSGTTAPANWYYQRVWLVSNPLGNTTLKRITVTTTVNSAVGNTGRVPVVTLMSLKTYPF